MSNNGTSANEDLKFSISHGLQSRYHGEEDIGLVAWEHLTRGGGGGA